MSPTCRARSTDDTRGYGVAHDRNGPFHESWGANVTTIQTPRAARSAPPRSTKREIAALVLMTFGGFVPPLGFLGVLAGLIWLWTSSIWRTSDKIVATIVSPGLLPIGLIMGIAALDNTSTECFGSSTVAMHCTRHDPGPDWVQLAFAVVWSGAAIAVLIRLAAQIRRAQVRNRTAGE